MDKRRVKQQNISVIGLFKLAGRHKKMDNVFIYHECQSTRWSHSVKTNKLNHKQRSSRAFYYVYVPFLYFLSGYFFLTVLSNLFSKPQSSLHTIQTL